MGKPQLTRRQRSLSRLQTICWAAEVLVKTGAGAAKDLPDVVPAFADTDRQHWERYALGLGGAGKEWIAKVEDVLPGTAQYFASGPKGIFGAIKGSRHQRRLFLEAILGINEDAFVRGDSGAKSDLFGPDLTQERLKLLADRDVVDVFYSSLVFHLGAIKRFWYIGREFYAAYEALEQFPSRTPVERATKKCWYEFLDATLVEADPFGNGFQWPPQIRVCDIEAAGDRALAAIKATESNECVPEVRIVDATYFEELATRLARTKW